MKEFPLPRLDENPELRLKLLSYCRLKPGEIWTDPVMGHRVGCLDATNPDDLFRLCREKRAVLAIQDPPYNLVAFDILSIEDYIAWSKKWVQATASVMADDAAFYVWIGADQNCHFQPLPDFMIMMREMGFSSRSLITMRNQRGYGTQKNWMAVRQELLYYVKGRPVFNIEAEYTDIPKILKGYYKEIAGKMTENIQRSKSENIRAGNVWVDIQQVFYRMEENINGCYAQKPLKSIERIIKASSNPKDLVIDSFAHSGTTLLACEKLGRTCCTMDIEPVFCEITIRRLERYRASGKLGWQNSNPFEVELSCNQAILPDSCNPISTRSDFQGALF